MTAINFLVRRDALSVISDGAQYDADGFIRSFGPKVYALPHLGAVVAARGNMLAAPIAASALGSRFRSFDHLIDGLELAFEDLHERFFPGEDIQLMIGGYSQSKSSFEYVFISSHPDLAERNAALRDSAGTPIQPKGFTLVRKGLGLYTAPAFPASDFLRAFGRPISSDDDITDVEVFARGLLEIQRQTRLGREIGCEVGRCWVGGFGTLTTITRSGVEAHVICAWPSDMIGAYLNPEPMNWDHWRAANQLPRSGSEKMTAAKEGLESKPSLNRAQRRALRSGKK
jgi:hypothetical protein